MRTNLCRQAPYEALRKALCRASYEVLYRAPYVMSVTVCEEDPTA
ncbi:hypothetical protein ACWGDT_26495 [Streptomyces avermitilis]